MNYLEIPDVAYTAGLFDGEGCISISVNRMGMLGTQIYLVNTNKEILEWLRDTTGIGSVTIHHSYSIKYPNQKISYSWHVYSQDKIRDFLEIIQPFLKIKARQCKIMLEYCYSRLNSRSRLTSKYSHNSYSEYENNLVAELRVLNRRGVVMGEEIKVLEAAYKANHMHALVGLEMVNRRA